MFFLVKMIQKKPINLNNLACFFSTKYCFFKLKLFSSNFVFEMKKTMFDIGKIKIKTTYMPNHLNFYCDSLFLTHKPILGGEFKR